MKLRNRLVHLTLILPLLVLGSAGVTKAEEEEAWQVPVVLLKDGWLHYTNGRFGCSLPIPPGMKALRPPDNGDGQAFASLDDKVRLTVSGHFNIDHVSDLDKSWESELAEKDRTITYKRKAEGWYVISGVNKDGTGFYEKYAANAKYFARWTITYPQADEKRYAPWIERMAKEFDPALGKGADTIE